MFSSPFPQSTNQEPFLFHFHFHKYYVVCVCAHECISSVYSTPLSSVRALAVVDCGFIKIVFFVAFPLFVFWHANAFGEDPFFSFGFNWIEIELQTIIYVFVFCKLFFATLLKSLWFLFPSRSFAAKKTFRYLTFSVLAQNDSFSGSRR